MTLARLDDHRRIWEGKPTLQAVYAVWFERLLEVTADRNAVLEVGAGPGFLSEYARKRRPRSWVASDLIPTPWNDVAADALRLPFASGSLDAVVGIDFIHHLEAPGEFLEEAARVLRPGGLLAAVEPWVTPFSYPIYRFLHQERCTWSVDPWQPFADLGPGKDAFEGDAAVPWRLVADTPAERWTALKLGSPRVEMMNTFAYLLSLGFRASSLLPAAITPALLAFDRWTRPVAPLLGMRGLVTWERLPEGGR